MSGVTRKSFTKTNIIKERRKAKIKYLRMTRYMIVILIVGLLINLTYQGQGIKSAVLEENQELKKQIAELESQLEQAQEKLIPAEPAVEGTVKEKVKETVAPVEEPIVPDYSIADSKVYISYFSQYYDYLEPTTTQLYNSNAYINFVKTDSFIFMSTSLDIKRLSKVNIWLDKRGMIYFKGCTQLEAEMIMQDLLDFIID